VFTGIAINQYDLETASGVQGGEGVTRPADTRWHFLVLNQKFWSARESELVFAPGSGTSSPVTWQAGVGACKS